jgi:ubiquinone biosynthesis protein UbiJ
VDALVPSPPAAASGLVRIHAPETMNLLGLMLKGVLERRLAAASPGVRRLRGDVRVVASGMAVTLRFADGGVEVTRAAPAGRPLATLEGTLTALCDAALGRRLVRAWLSGALRVRGRILALLRLLSLLRASEP